VTGPFLRRNRVRRLKPWLLPVWNGGHRLAWRMGEYLGAIRHRRFGICDVCGRFGPWLYRRRVVPSKLQERWGLTERLAEALASKESSDCSWCGAKLRVRRLARALLDLEGPAEPARSVAAWVRRAEVRSLRIAEINRIEGLHEILAGLPNFQASDYTPGAERGALIAGVRSEDLTRLTYPDASFDLVLSSETLEHVPDLAAALAEIRRVLVPGGWHLFTVPLLPGVPTTFSRMVVLSDGSLDHHAPPIYHPGGDVGYPVFTEFGANLIEVVKEAGFEVEMRFGPVSDDDLGQVFVSRKT
jgi:Methyltransferase domain